MTEENLELANKIMTVICLVMMFGLSWTGALTAVQSGAMGVILGAIALDELKGA